VNTKASKEPKTFNVLKIATNSHSPIPDIVSGHRMWPEVGQNTGSTAGNTPTINKLIKVIISVRFSGIGESCRPIPNRVVTQSSGKASLKRCKLPAGQIMS